jgi:hypothetical protein
MAKYIGWNKIKLSDVIDHLNMFDRIEKNGEYFYYCLLCSSLGI